MYCSIEDLDTIEDEPTQPKRPCPSITEVPHYHFLHLLLGNPSSLWKHSSTDVDETAVWGRSNEYFEFLVNLLKRLTGTCAFFFKSFNSFHTACTCSLQ